ncbi:MAG: hypothetical protein IPL79_14845 [Myxococcales bacterium]|nr:hypothetical protein [Myxococcales bacterium]
MSAPELRDPVVRISDALIYDLRPQAGARFVLLRGASDADRADYAAAIISPDAAWHFRVELAAGTAQPPVITADTDDVETVRAHASPPASSDVDMLTMVARLTARAAPTRATDGLTPWPPRIVRWRGPGRGG